MPPTQRASGRGRRDPNLLADQEKETLAQTVGAVPDDDGADGYDRVDEEMVLLYEGDTVRAGVSIPVTLGGMDRFSLIQAEATATVQGDEVGLDTAARARAAMRVSFFETLDEMEDDLQAYAERKAAEAEEVDRALRARRTN